MPASFTEFKDCLLIIAPTWRATRVAIGGD
jgi:hypothetical protein